MKPGLFTLAGWASLAARVSSLLPRQTTSPSLLEALNSTQELSNFTALLGQANLATTLENLTNLTILAPNNAAVVQLLSGPDLTTTDLVALLAYHVLSGEYANDNDVGFVATQLQMPAYTNVTGGQVVEIRDGTVYSGLGQNASIVSPPITFTGGFIHIIDRVLTLPQTVSTTLLDYGLTSSYGAINLTDILNTIDSTPDFTIFVPENAGFQAIGAVLANLTIEQLLGILTYHFVNGTAYTDLLADGEALATLQGNNVTIRKSATSENIFVNNARVIVPDILVANGVVHVIDEVLNPENSTVPSGIGDSGEPAFAVGTDSTTGAPFTSGAPSANTVINLSTAAAGATATATASAGSNSSSGADGANGPKQSGLSGGAIAGIVVGGLVLLLALAAVAFLAGRRSRKQQTAVKKSNSEFPSSTSTKEKAPAELHGQGRVELDHQPAPSELDGKPRVYELHQ